MRVVAGRLRGRRLLRASGDTRPTMDRARAGLFDWLGPRIEGARVLDLFAGSGTLGIEALSRGAREVVFVERARAAREVLRRNLESLDLLAETRIVAADVRRALAQLSPRRGEGEPFDVVFADPPYGRGWLERLAGDANLVNLLAPAGLFIAERSTREPPAAGAPELALRESRRYGETQFDWYERKAGQ